MLNISGLNRRASGPTGISLVQLMSIALAVGIMIVFTYSVSAMLLDNRADQNQKEEVNRLLNEMRLVCMSGEARKIQFNILPKYGLVYLEGLSQEYEKQKIVEETGCTDHCLCVIKRESQWQPDLIARHLKSRYNAKVSLLDTDEFRQFLADTDTKIVACIDLVSATSLKGRSCFDTITLENNLRCGVCDLDWEDDITMPDYWGLPVYWTAGEGLESGDRQLAILSTNCAWRTELWLRKSGKAFSIESWVLKDYIPPDLGIFELFSTAYQQLFTTIHDKYGPCTFFSCYAVNEAGIGTGMELCNY